MAKPFCVPPSGEVRAPGTKNSRRALFMALCLSLAFPLYAQEKPGGRPSGLVFSGSVQHYLLSDEPFQYPWPGIRLFAGWEFPLGPGGGGALGLETGWTGSSLVRGVRPDDFTNLVPVVLRAGCRLALGQTAFSLRLDMLAGALFSQTGKETHLSPLAGARLDAECRLSEEGARPGWSFYAGGGANIVPETGGLVLMPVVEAGFKLRPNVIFGKKEQPAPERNPETPPPGGEDRPDAETGGEDRPASAPSEAEPPPEGFSLEEVLQRQAEPE